MDESSLPLGMPDEHSNISQLDDPWDLPPYFLLRTNKWKSLRTYSGYWKEIEEERTAIRSAGESSSSSSSPSYVGVRKTLEFYLNDGTRGGEGTKTDWIIHEYHHLRRGDAGEEALFLQEDVVLRKVFRNCKSTTEHASSLYSHVESYVKAYGQSHHQGPSTLYTWNKNSVLTSRHLFFGQSPRPLFKTHEVFDLEFLSKELSGGPLDCGENSDSVWKLFTKILPPTSDSPDDPDEVYAVCHRCDKVLKAHPKKHGTSHLKRHILTCSSCTNPSTDVDREMLHRLRAALDDPSQKHKMEERPVFQQLLITQKDNLTPSWYVTRSLKNRQTEGGFWKEIHKDLTAIRIEQPQMQRWWKETAAIQMVDLLRMQVPQPQYMGLRRTLQFHHQESSNKTNWFMFEYQQIDGNKVPALHLQGDMVIRMVFRYDEDAVSSALGELDRLLNGDADNQEYFNGEGMNTDTTMSSSDYMDTPVDRKRKRTGAASRSKSGVWMHFTKIHSRDRGLVYVICHTCDRGYSSGRSSNGTSHLWRHNKSCASKHPRTGDANNASAAWEAEIWPLFLILNNSQETEQQVCGSS